MCYLGPFHELENHVEECYRITHPHKNCSEINQSMKDRELQLDIEKQQIMSVINVFSLEKVCFNGKLNYLARKFS